MSRRTDNTAKSNAEEYSEQQIELNESLTAKLQALARQNQLTLNTIVQGVWALLLGLHAEKEDVVFGVVVSGRSAEIAGVESTVGLFINTLPVRAKIAAEAGLIAWLKQSQAQQAETSQYDYSALAQVQAWSEVPRGTPLFESIFVFENYPIETAAEAWLEESHGGLRVGRVRSLERSNYPLTIWAIPGRELVLKIGYSVRRWDDETLNELLEDYRTLLEAIASNPERRISELLLPVAAKKRVASV
jgi:non-ribosomal peptide synthetase component F